MTADGMSTCTCAGRPAKGRAAKEPCCAGREPRAAKPGLPKARRPRRADAASNIVPLPGAALAKRRRAASPPDHLPSGHMAQIIFFTGVQIVRDGTHG